jgi:hypothetical protein
MDIQTLLWKLAAIGDCSILDKETREAAKVAGDVLNNTRNLLTLPALADASTIATQVHGLIPKPPPF